MSRRHLLVAAGMAGAAGPAHAEPWIAAEVPAAVPLSAPHLDLFRAGAMPALGGYFAVSPNVSFGLRMRFGYLAEGASPSPGMRDPGRGGLVTGSIGVRVKAAGTWLEAAAGGGVTGTDPVPTFEVGAGYGFVAGRVTLGPTVRYLRVIGGDGAMDPGSAAIVLVGLEVSMSSRRRRVVAAVPRLEVVAPVVPVEPEPEAAPEPPPPPDRDGDGIADADDQCPDEIEIVNGVDDTDGCPDSGLFQVVNDRIILDERVLFDRERARVHSRGKKVIEAIALAWRLHSEWVHFSIEGHADVRGADTYNDKLSQLRAERVREALVAAGVPAEAVDAEGYGESRPRDLGRNEAAHQRNRRVEFGITRGRR